jgi:integrase
MGLLLEVFGQLSIEQIKPQDVRRYLHMRGAHPVAANREIALLSHIFNKARNWGYLEIANPCTGIERYRESGRDKYVTDEEYDALYRHADPLLRDAMDLAYFTAQRVADVLKMKVADVRDGYIWIAQNKTKAKLRVELVGDLAAVIERIMRRKADSKVTLLRKPEDEQLLASGGMRVSYDLLRWRFTRARKLAGVDFQFRDLRAKAATDIDNLDRAQRLLGHSTRTMTEHYTKNRAGEKVVPLLHFPGRKVIDKKAD